MLPSAFGFVSRVQEVYRQGCVYIYIYTYNWDLLVVCQCVVTEFMKKGANMRQKVVALVGFNIS